MSIDTVMQDFLRDARVLRKWDARNEPLAARMEARASYLDELKDRKAVVTANNGERVELDTEAAAYTLATRIISKIDPNFGGEVECYQIGEPGYDPNIGVFANWNKYPKWQVAIEKLERLGCPISAEWSDEWVDCGECGKAYRSSPDCYGWTKSWWLAYDCEIICADCTRKHMLDEYLNWLTESHERADLFLSDGELEDAGWQRLDADFENGLYGNQAAEPKKIAAYLRKHGFDRIIFKVDSVGQFDMDFSVWVSVTDDDMVLTAKDANRALRQAYWSDLNGPDPAVMMQRALKSIPPMRNDGTIQFNKVNVGTGTVETRYLTPEEFA